MGTSGEAIQKGNYDPSCFEYPCNLLISDDPCCQLVRRPRSTFVNTTSHVLLSRPLYRLRSSDVVEVTFTVAPEFNQTLTVQPDGYVTLKDAGAVLAQGLTIPEFGDAVRKAYAGYREVVDDAGFTFQRGNATDLADRLRFLIANPAIRETAGATARKRIEDHYQWQKIAEDIESAYLEILGERPEAVRVKKPSTTTAIACNPVPFRKRAG